MIMKELYSLVDHYIRYAREFLELNERDVFYIQNRVLEILQRVEGEELSADEQDEIYGVLSLLPSAVNAKFQTLCKENTKAATD